MKDMNYKVVFVDQKGRDIDFVVNMIPGFKEIFITAYNMAAEYFNENIESFNKDFDSKYPDHKTDLDNVNDIYYNFISNKMEPHCELINFILLGPDSKYKFGYYEQANFGLKLDNKTTISVVLKPVK